jgi:hypothetical protein
MTTYIAIRLPAIQSAAITSPRIWREPLDAVARFLVLGGEVAPVPGVGHDPDAAAMSTAGKRVQRLAWTMDEDGGASTSRPW